jgi:nitronate monooxygenase
MSFSSEALAGKKAWKDIWGSGQGIGAVKQIQSAAALVAQLKNEYFTSLQNLNQLNR